MKPERLVKVINEALSQAEIHEACSVLTREVDKEYDGIREDQEITGQMLVEFFHGAPESLGGLAFEMSNCELLKKLEESSSRAHEMCMIDSLHDSMSVTRTRYE